MRYIEKCRSCLSKNLTHILSFGDFYLSDFVAGNTKPKKYGLTLILCEDCSLLQLSEIIPPAALYTSSYGYKSGINNTVRNDLKEIAKKALREVVFTNKKKDVILDIGANDGTLLSFYKPTSHTLVAIDPLSKFAKECKTHADIVITDYFSQKAFAKKLGNKKAKIITAISCFYDIEDPNKFVSDIKKILSNDGIFIIQQNYLPLMLKQNAFDNIVHEHLEYYSLSSLQNLLNRHKLEVYKVETNNINGGSFRVFIRHARGTPKNILLDEKSLRLNDKKTYIHFAARVKNIKAKLTKFIKQKVKQGKTVYVYGASTRGNTLLQYCKLDHKIIKKAVERNPQKWGKKIASVGISVISEEQARKEKPDYMLVLPWFFKEEFLKRERNYLEKGGTFIFPLPKPTVVTKNGETTL